MKKKKFLNRDQVFEFFNPVLDGSTIDCDTSINTDVFQDFYDRPNGLECDDDSDNFEYGGRPPGKRWYLSTTYINGQPLTDWSARFLNNPTYTNKSVQLSNLYNVYMLMRSKIDGLLHKQTCSEIDETSIKNIKILKIKKEQGIHISFVLTFDLNDNTDIWCKITNFDKMDYKFICSEISNLSKEEQLKIKGKIINALKKFLTPESGFYTLLAKEFYTYNNFGQIVKLKEGDLIEVINTKYGEVINIKKDGNLYIIKKPDYYYFNWLFSKK